MKCDACWMSNKNEAEAMFDLTHLRDIFLQNARGRFHTQQKNGDDKIGDEETPLRTDPPILAATSRSRDTTEIRAWKIRDREVAASKIVGLVFE
jgi:hypothetical protein